MKKLVMKKLAISVLSLSACLASERVFATPSDTATDNEVGPVGITVQNHTSQNLTFGLRNFSSVANFSNGNYQPVYNFTSSSQPSGLPIPSQDSVSLPAMQGGSPGRLDYSFTASYSSLGADLTQKNLPLPAEIYYDNNDGTKQGGGDPLWSVSGEGPYECQNETLPWQAGLGADDAGTCWYEALADEDSSAYSNSHNNHSAYDLDAVAPNVDIIIGSGASSVTLSLSGVTEYRDTNATAYRFLNGNNVLTSSDGQSLFVVCLGVTLNSNIGSTPEPDTFAITADTALNPGSVINTTTKQVSFVDQNDVGMINKNFLLDVWPLSGPAAGSGPGNTSQIGKITPSPNCTAQRYPSFS